MIKGLFRRSVRGVPAASGPHYHKWLLRPYVACSVGVGAPYVSQVLSNDAAYVTFSTGHREVIGSLEVAVQSLRMSTIIFPDGGSRWVSVSTRRTVGSVVTSIATLYVLRQQKAP